VAKGVKDWYMKSLIDKDGVYHKRLFTCKHFNKEQRICGNYENRPHMCKNFGVGCAYAGCGFDKLYQSLNAVENESSNQ